MPLSDWCATDFFRNLCGTNKLAQAEHFVFTQCSGLDGFEEALQTMQSSVAFVAVSDINDGYTELNNTPRTRRVKTVFLAMRHAPENMDARTSAWKPCASCSDNSCRCLPSKGSSWSRTASTLTPEYRSTRLTDISSPAAPVHIFRLQWTFSPI